MSSQEEMEQHVHNHYEDGGHVIKNDDIEKMKIRKEMQQKKIRFNCTITSCPVKKKSVQSIVDHVKSHCDKMDFVIGEQESYKCPICSVQEPTFYEVWIHVQEHKEKAHDKSNGIKKEKKKPNGGPESNVPRLDGLVTLADKTQVNFGMYLLHAMVESAKENYLDLQSGATVVPWNKKIVREWIWPRVPGSEMWTDETLKKRFQALEKKVKVKIT